MDERKKRKMKIKLLKDYLLIVNNKTDIDSLIDINSQNPEFILHEALEVLFEEANQLNKEKGKHPDAKLKVKAAYLDALYLKYLESLEKNINYLDRTTIIKN